MSPSNALNDLVNAGKADIHGFVKEYFDVFLTKGNEEQKRLAMSVHSLLALALKKTLPDINVAHIRSLIIEENMSVLSQLSDTDARVLPLFAVATGRIMQAREYISAAKRVGQTYMDEAEAVSRFLGALWDRLALAERAAVRLALDESGAPILRDIKALYADSAFATA